MFVIKYSNGSHTELEFQQIEQQKKEEEKAALERMVSAQAERLRRAERTNYALSVHLHRASPGGMPDNRPPDVY